MKIREERYSTLLRVFNLIKLDKSEIKLKDIWSNYGTGRQKAPINLFPKGNSTLYSKMLIKNESN
jgi:hypothetical protein